MLVVGRVFFKKSRLDLEQPFEVEGAAIEHLIERYGRLYRMENAREFVERADFGFDLRNVSPRRPDRSC